MWTYWKTSITDLIGRSIVLRDSSMVKQAAANIIQLDPTILKAYFVDNQVEHGE